MSKTPRTDARVFKILSDLQSGTRDVVDADLARELELENTAMKELIDNPNAMHTHYLRECNGWEVWHGDRVRKMESDIMELEDEIVEANGLLDMRMKEIAKLKQTLIEVTTELTAIKCNKIS